MAYFELAPFGPLVDVLFLVVPVVVVCFGLALSGLLVVVLFLAVPVVAICCSRVVFHVLLVDFVRNLG